MPLSTFSYAPGQGRTVGDGSSQVIHFVAYPPYFVAELWGCGGSGSNVNPSRRAGQGTRVKARIDLPGSAPVGVELRCGGRAYAGDNFSGSVTPFDGFNGGGFHSGHRYSIGSGGGMTDVRPDGGTIDDAWVIAAGGGAKADWGDGLGNSSYGGGDAGAPGATAPDAPNFGYGIGHGASQVAGGYGDAGGIGTANPGTKGQGGTGIGTSTGGGGGGGGGYWGGCGGKGWDGHGGSAGSSRVKPVASVVLLNYDAGLWTGLGQAVIQRFTEAQVLPGHWHLSQNPFGVAAPLVVSLADFEWRLEGVYTGTNGASSFPVPGASPAFVPGLRGDGIGQALRLTGNGNFTTTATFPVVGAGFAAVIVLGQPPTNVSTEAIYDLSAGRTLTIVRDGTNIRFRRLDSGAVGSEVLLSASGTVVAGLYHDTAAGRLDVSLNGVWTTGPIGLPATLVSAGDVTLRHNADLPTGTSTFDECAVWVGAHARSVVDTYIAQVL